MRAMLLALESRLDAKIPVTHHVIAWLVEHAADVLNKFAVGIDGRTTYERMKEKKYRGEIIKGRRRVMYKIPCKPKGGLMTERWVLGTWLWQQTNGRRHAHIPVSTATTCSSDKALLPTQKAGVWTTSTISSEQPGTRQELIKLNGEK